MSLSDLASLGSFVSGVAVLVSLVYLAIQVRQNTRNVRAQIAVSHFEMVARIDELVADPRYLEAFEKGSRGDRDIKQEEFLQFAYLSRTFMTYVYTDWLMDREALLHRGTHASYQGLAAGTVMARPGWRAWWKAYGFQFPEAFRAEIDRRISDTRPSDNDLGFEAWKTQVTRELADMAPDHPAGRG